MDYHELAGIDLTTVIKEIESSNFKQAAKSQEWIYAIKLEVDALQINGTWSLVNPPMNNNIVTCHWVFRIKRTDGSLERRKEWLVA